MAGGDRYLRKIFPMNRPIA